MASMQNSITVVLFTLLHTCVLYINLVDAEADDTDEELNKEPVTYSKMEWKAANIILMVAGLVLILSLVLTGALLAIFKPYAAHKGKVYRDDGTLDVDATEMKQRSLGKRPSIKKPKINLIKDESFDLLDEEDEEAILKMSRSRTKRKSILDKTKLVTQHMPEMLENEREITKTNLRKAAKYSRKNSLPNLRKFRSASMSNSNALNV